MSKHEIEIPELPEGWRPVAYRQPNKDVDWCFLAGEVTRTYNPKYEQLIVEKIQPRRVVIDITQEEYALLLKIPIEQRMFDNPVTFDLLRKIQSAQVKETDLSLTKDDDKLSLSVEECNSLLDTIDVNVVRKIQQFIKDK